MARNASPRQRAHAAELILTGLFTEKQIATACDISVRSVRRYRANLRTFGAVEAPYILRGLLRVVTPLALRALLTALVHKPSMYRDEMAVFLYD